MGLLLGGDVAGVDRVDPVALPGVLVEADGERAAPSRAVTSSAGQWSFGQE